GVMTRRVVAVRRDAGYKEIVAVLRSRRISAFPVLDDADRVVGVVSEADLLLKEADSDLPGGVEGPGLRRKERAKASGVIAEELMTSPAVTIGPDASVADAARLMRARRVKRLPVVEEGDRLIGLLSRADALSVVERPDADP